jgi:hypothetical protein
MKKAFWDKPNPNKRSTKLDENGKQLAREMARKAGRPYPNLVDNAAAARRMK